MSTPTSVAPLATIADLADLPGAPFDDRELDLAIAEVRGYCGWHIAPVLPATLTGSGTGGPRLVLPTLRPKLITSVRAYDRAGNLGAPMIGWRAVSGGVLFRSQGWPAGDHNVTATVEHGFEACPGDLLKVIATLARGGRSTRDPDLASRSKTVLGVSRSETYRSDGGGLGIAATAVLDRYRLPV